jgi:hypothetical protein
MDLKNIPHTFTRKAAIGLVFALALALLSVSAVFAALQAIDTNNTTDDWATAVPFQTDASGDVNDGCSGYSGKDDIIQTFVATGPSDPPTHIWFGVKTAAASAISDQYHQVSAYIDCGPDGAPPDGPEVNDAVIIYRGPADQVVYGDGFWGGGGNDRPTPYYIITTQYPQNGPEGERPDDAIDKVEWGMPFSDFDVIKEPLPEYDPNCGSGSEARVKFYTFKVTAFGSYDCGYDETDWAGFDIPTVVELNSLSAQSNSAGVDRLTISAAALLGAAAVAGLGFMLIHKRNRSA